MHRNGTALSIDQLAFHEGLRSFDVILVEPQESRNVGAVARAMANFGCTRLHLVAPREYEPRFAKVTACWAGALIDGAVIHPDLAEAIAPMNEVIGFSSRSGKNRGEILDLEQWARACAPREGCRIALLFGPEDTGLRSEHTAICSSVVQIPTSPAYPSLNLSHACAIALYELSRSLPSETEREPAAIREAAPWSDFEQLDRLVDSSARQSGFFGPGTPGPVPDLVRSMLRRVRPDKREMGVLMGLFGCIDRALKRRAEN